VTKLAEDRAEQLKRDPDKVAHELNLRLRKDLIKMGNFSRIHPMPQSGQDVPDDLDARLVVLGIDHPYSKEPGSAAETAAKAILESRGNTPRLYRDTLIFLAADKTRLQDLDEAARKYLAWKSILAEKETLNLDPQQVKQAETQKAAADGTVRARLPETYQWLLVPVQTTPQSAIEWQATRLSGQDALAVRASKKLKNDELLITGFAATRLRMELDRVPLWRGDHVAIKQVAENFARYPYPPRRKDPSVLLGAIRDGLALLSWMQDSFAFAESFGDSENRYRGLRAGQIVSPGDAGAPGLLVKPEVARKQMTVKPTRIEIVPDQMYLGPGGTATFKALGFGADGQDLSIAGAQWSAQGGTVDSAGFYRAGATEGEFAIEVQAGDLSARATAVVKKGAPPPPPPPPPPDDRPKRFHGTVTPDATRVGRDASRIADEVIAHLSGLVGAKVTVTLEVEAEIPSGAPDHVVRTVTENSRTLRFASQAFEKE
jgi:hypothetical protein